MSMLSIKLLILLIIPVFCQQQDLQQMRKLEKQILDQVLNVGVYDKRIVPSNNTGPVVVNTNMYIRNIEYIDTIKQEWKVQITFRQQWTDSRLKFDDKNGKLRYLSLHDPDRIWTPDTFISNSRITYANKDIKPNVLVRIFPNGNILYSIRLTTTLSCPMDLKHYPFDTQECHIQLASYGYTTDDIVYLWKEGDPVQVTKNLHLLDFTLKVYKTDYCTSRTNTGEYSCMKVVMKFDRVHNNHQWLLPTAFLTLLSFASFWMKPSKKCRLTYLALIMTMLYIHTVYINNKASLDLSYSTALDCWLHTCIIFVLGAFVEYAVVAFISRRNKQAKEHYKRHQDPAAKEALLENGKESTEENKENIGLVQKWKESPISCKIDSLAAILFPLAFIIYMVIFTCYEKHRSSD